MKRLKKIASLLCTVIFCIALVGSTAMADASKTVTLGADLSEEEKTMILNYFGVNGEDIPTLTINNTDEREHLADYVPIEQIGTRTYSCSYVSPTTSGGIQVKTANLTWVTSNMIAAALSTSGVTNCDVLAACPFPVSGTGALTGILMAYETAADEELDDEKKDVSMQELVTTATIGDDIGQEEATLLVNETKTQVIEGKVVDEDEIKDIVDDTAEDINVSLSDEDRDLLTSLLERISQLDYDIEEMRETLERVEQNALQEIDDPSVNIDIDISNDNGSTVNQDSILNNTDDTALEDAEIDATFEDNSDADETDEIDPEFDIMVEDDIIIPEETETKAETETESETATKTETETETGTEAESETESNSITSGFVEGLVDFMDGLFGTEETEQTEPETEESADNTFLDGIIEGLTGEEYASNEENQTEEETDADVFIPTEEDFGSCTVTNVTPDTIYTDAPDQQITFTIKNTINSNINAVLKIESDLTEEETQMSYKIPAEENVSVTIDVEKIPEEDSAELSYILTLEDGTEDFGEFTFNIKDPEEILLSVGDELYLTDNFTSIIPNSDDNEEPEIKWESSDTKVAEIDSGLLTAKTDGEAFIRETFYDGTVIIYHVIVGTDDTVEEDTEFRDDLTNALDNFFIEEVQPLTY